jgi:hypothetical protein
MSLPSDPGYISPAPAHVQKHSRLFRTLLAMNDDPYQPYSYSQELIMQIESSLVIPVEG